MWKVKLLKNSARVVHYFRKASNLKATITSFWKHCIINNILSYFLKHHPTLSNSQRNVNSNVFIIQNFGLQIQAQFCLTSATLSLGSLFDWNNWFPPRQNPGDSSLKIFSNVGDGYDKQTVAGAPFLWSSQVCKDSSTGLWFIHVTIEVPCVTPVVWNGVSPWFHAIYNYNIQFSSELNRKESEKKEKELQLLRATDT